MVSTESLLIGGASVVAAFILTRGSGSSSNTSAGGMSSRQPTGPTQGDVLDTISAFNEGKPGVTEQDVLDSISAFNEGTSDSGTDTDTADVPGYVQNFAPSVRQQIQSLSNEQIAALPDSADNEPLSTADVRKRLGRGELYDGFADKIPDSDPVNAVQTYFQSKVV